MGGDRDKIEHDGREFKKIMSQICSEKSVRGGDKNIMFRRKKAGIPKQLVVPPVPNPNPKYKPPVGAQREECRYYAPCGLCTFYNTECVQQRGRKTKGKTPCDNRPNRSDDELMNRIRAGEGLPPLNMGRIDEHNLPSGLTIEKRE